LSATLSRWLIPESSEQLGWGFLVSLGVHLLLVALIMFWPGWGFNKREIFTPVYNVNLVGGPPRLAPPAPPAAKPTPKPKAKPTAKPVAKPKPAPKPQPKKEAIATKKEAVKPKRLERKKTEPQVDQSKELEKRIKRLQTKVAEERAVESAISRLESRVQARSGGGGAGPAGGGSKLSAAFQLYYTNLRAQVHRNWVLPENAGNKLRGLEAIIVIRIRRNGHLERAWLEKSSGNSRLDSSALRAVERAAPFPPLPPESRERVHEVGFRFRPEDITG
jgi:colicin import membrane protein